MARPKTPRVPPAPPDPVPVDVLVAPVDPVLVVDDVEPPAPVLVEVVTLLAAHSPVAWSQAWPSGQMTPAHGQLPHAPVTGSQQEPLVHVVGVHRFGTHVGVGCDRSQISPAAQGVLQSATQAPLTQTSPDLQTLPAHDSTQVWSVNVGLGLHS